MAKGSFNFSISPSNEYSGLISFRMEWLDLLAVQGTLKSLLQHHSSNASILQSSAFFIVQLSHPHMTTGKTIALTRQTFIGKVMSLLFNMLCGLVITFLGSECYLRSKLSVPLLQLHDLWFCSIIWKTQYLVIDRTGWVLASPVFTTWNPFREPSYSYEALPSQRVYSAFHPQKVKKEMEVL